MTRYHKRDVNAQAGRIPGRKNKKRLKEKQRILREKREMAKKD